ncbi:hypothetical protein [Persicobacter psychrovividus]|uniref:Uncharacterized protein n=1 Tax=Persicobacter psychrovividus TaxID=387638 RepID=A0ABN6LGX6_9BACT|nr:hypothetical protein PEPS_30290 [Persicobacter psychrovividus]
MSNNTQNNQHLDPKKKVELSDKMKDLLKARKAPEQPLFSTEDPSFEASIDQEVSSLIAQIEDPEKNTQTYYAIQNIIVGLIPDKEIRRPVLDEKNIMLRGLKKTDVRMSFLSEKVRALDIIHEWVSTSGNAHDLYLAFHEENVRLGYKPSEEEE